MKEERMAILGMLEKGIITVSEAERLLLILQHEEDERMNIDGMGATIGSAINKAGDVLSSFAKTVGETTEKVAEKVEPKIKKAASTIADKAASFAEDARNYAEKKKQEFSEADDEECDCEDCEEEMQEDFEETQQLLQKLKQQPEENLTEEEKRFRKKMTGFMDAVEFQQSQLDSENELLKQMEQLKESDEEETDK